MGNAPNPARYRGGARRSGNPSERATSISGGCDSPATAASSRLPVRRRALGEARAVAFGVARAIHAGAARRVDLGLLRAQRAVAPPDLAPVAAAVGSAAGEHAHSHEECSLHSRGTATPWGLFLAAEEGWRRRLDSNQRA